MLSSLRRQLTIVSGHLVHFRSRGEGGLSVASLSLSRLCPFSSALPSSSSPTSSPSSSPESDIVGPGASSPSLIATPYEQAVGSERVELLGDLSGRSAFLTAPLVVDHYGTLKDPIKVDSVEGARLVGCTGFPKYSHEPMWFWVEHDHGPTRCIECGQAFAINKIK